MTGSENMANMNVEEYQKRSREYEISEARKGLTVHVAVITNCMVQSLPW